jgi:hypothetical protein
MDAGKVTLHQPEAGPIRIVGADGRDLLVIHPDGTVTGDVADAGEAARVFVREVAYLLRTAGHDHPGTRT